MASSSFQISLPEPLKAYVDAQIEAGDYGTPSEYVRDLVYEDKERRLVRLEAELLAALKGEPIKLSQAEIERGDVVDLLRQRLNDQNPR